MKINLKVETLIRELSELLWDNNLAVITDPTHWHHSYIQVQAVDKDPEVQKEMAKTSIETLYHFADMNATLFWFRKLTAKVEFRIEVNNAKSSFVEDRSSEALEALRSRVMVKALHAGRDNADIRANIAEALDREELESVERELDTEHSLISTRASIMEKVV